LRRCWLKLKGGGLGLVDEIGVKDGELVALYGLWRGIITIVVGAIVSIPVVA